MSSFTGLREEPWSLSRAVDALAGAARAAGRPGLVWIAGIGYPSVGLGLGASLTGDWLGGESGFSWIPDFGGEGGSEGLAVFWLLFLPVIMRLRIGLARIAPPDIWNPLVRTFGNPRLRQTWRSGKGLTFSTLGMLIMLSAMMLAAVLAVLAPAILLAQGVLPNLAPTPRILASILILLPSFTIVAAYSLALSVLHQLALQSLAHNRRGVASALTHAWRIARNDPWATGRTLAVDLLLNVTVFILGQALVRVLSLTCAAELAILVVYLPLLGFMGVTRAGYWARAYRALGGLSPDDRVPGLKGEVVGIP